MASKKSDSRSPAISVIVPCFNNQETIERALESVCAQTITPIEVLVIDDASTDYSVVIVEHFIKRFKVLRIIKFSINQGAAKARNAGWDLAQGDLIAFLDADDTWHPRKLEIQATWMCNNCEVQICGHAYDIAQRNQTDQLPWPEIIDFGKVKNYRFTDFLIKNRLSTPTVMLRCSVRERFPEDKRFCEDFALWLRISHSYGGCVWSPSKLTRLHKQAWGESGLSGDLRAMHMAEKQCYLDCHQRQWINTPRLIILQALSIAKYLRRLVTITINKMFA